MSDTTVESIVWIVGIFLFGIAAVAPQYFIRVLGRGMVSPSQSALLFFRAVAAICLIGAVYRLFVIHQQ